MKLASLLATCRPHARCWPRSPPAADRQQARKLMDDGNYQEALEQVPRADARRTASERLDGRAGRGLSPGAGVLPAAQPGARDRRVPRGGRRRRTPRTGSCWRRSRRATSSTHHHGFMIAGEFRRGDHRGGGEGDARHGPRSRAGAAALPAGARDGRRRRRRRRKRARRSRWRQFRRRACMPGGYYQAWRLQTAHRSRRAARLRTRAGATTAAARRARRSTTNGNPVFYGVPDSWDDAAERRRALAVAAGHAHRSGSPTRELRELRERADFLQSQFGVRDDGRLRLVVRPPDRRRRRRPRARSRCTRSATTRRSPGWPTGIKRFKLPEEHNYLALLPADRRGVDGGRRRLAQRRSPRWPRSSRIAGSTRGPPSCGSSWSTASPATVEYHEPACSRSSATGAASSRW